MGGAADRPEAVPFALLCNHSGMESLATADDLAEVRRAYPKAFTASSWGPDDYDPLLATFGKPVVKVDEDAYSGDSFVLYDEPLRTLIFGWGSCSGCDALQGAESFDEVAELRRELRESIVEHESPEALLAWLDSRDESGSYYTIAEAWASFDARVREYVAKR